MLKGVVSISENTSGNEDVKKKKQMLADKLCGSVHIDQKSVESDDRLNYILEK